MKRVCDLNWSDPKFIRAGVIPFVVIKGIKFYAFGIEDAVAAIGDFGGHREIKDKDALDSALREYEEEALNVFGVLTRDNVQEYQVLEGIDTAEILVPVKGYMSDYTIKFRKLVGDNKNHEIQNINWLSSQQLLAAINNPQINVDGTKVYHMYNRILNTILMNQEYV